MDEYIERKKLEEAFDNADPDVCESDMDGYSDWGFGRENVRDVIKGVPAADVASVVHGRWLHTDLAYHWTSLDECSVCGYHDDERRHLSDYYYCPNCGAKMDGGAGNAAD